MNNGQRELETRTSIGPSKTVAGGYQPSFGPLAAEERVLKRARTKAALPMVMPEGLNPFAAHQHSPFEVHGE